MVEIIPRWGKVGCVRIENRLKSSVIASSFGKLKGKKQAEMEDAKPEDISRSLLIMISANTLQIAHMLAQLEDLSTIILIGSHFDALEFMQMCSVQKF